MSRRQFRGAPGRQMNPNEIKELVELLAEKDIAEFEMERDDVKLRIKRSATKLRPQRL